MYELFFFFFLNLIDLNCILITESLLFQSISLSGRKHCKIATLKQSKFYQCMCIKITKLSHHRLKSVRVVISVGMFMVNNSILTIVCFTSSITKKCRILSICNELPVKNSRQMVYFDKNIFMWLKMLFYIWIKVLAEELALEGISNHESLDYYY